MLNSLRDETTPTIISCHMTARVKWSFVSERDWLMKMWFEIMAERSDLVCRNPKFISFASFLNSTPLAVRFETNSKGKYRYKGVKT